MNISSGALPAARADRLRSPGASASQVAGTAHRLRRRRIAPVLPRRRRRRCGNAGGIGNNMLRCATEQHGEIRPEIPATPGPTMPASSRHISHAPRSIYSRRDALLARSRSGLDHEKDCGSAALRGDGSVMPAHHSYSAHCSYTAHCERDTVGCRHGVSQQPHRADADQLDQPADDRLARVPQRGVHRSRQRANDRRAPPAIRVGDYAAARRSQLVPVRHRHDDLRGAAICAPPPLVPLIAPSNIGYGRASARFSGSGEPANGLRAPDPGRDRRRRSRRPDRLDRRPAQRTAAATCGR